MPNWEINMILENTDGEVFSKERVEEMFDSCLERTDHNSESGDFIHGLHRYFEERGELTPKQLDALERYYSNLESIGNV